MGSDLLFLFVFTEEDAAAAAAGGGADAEDDDADGGVGAEEEWHRTASQRRTSWPSKRFCLARRTAVVAVAVAVAAVLSEQCIVFLVSVWSAAHRRLCPKNNNMMVEETLGMSKLKPVLKFSRHPSITTYCLC